MSLLVSLLAAVVVFIARWLGSDKTLSNSDCIVCCRVNNDWSRYSVRG